MATEIQKRREKRILQLRLRIEKQHDGHVFLATYAKQMQMLDTMQAEMDLRCPSCGESIENSSPYATPKGATWRVCGVCKHKYVDRRNKPVPEKIRKALERGWKTTGETGEG